MALIKCPDCGKMISPRAKLCPECGCPSEYFLKSDNVSQEETRSKEAYSNHSEEDTSDRIPKSNQLEKENEKDIYSLFSEESYADNDLNNNSHWEEMQRLEKLYVYDEYAVTKHGFIMGKSLVKDFENLLGVTAEEMDEEYADLLHDEIMDKLEKIKGIDRSHNAQYHNYYLKNMRSILWLEDSNEYVHIYIFDKNNKLIYINEYNCEWMEE